MSRYTITEAQAFNLMRVVSQKDHRKIRDIARDIAETGTIDVPTMPPTAAA